MYYTTAKKIVAAKKFFNTNPSGIINTGMWNCPYWTKETFYIWFRKCLNEKTGIMPPTEKDINLAIDYRRVKDYKEKRITQSGRNIMLTKTFKKIYPYLDNTEIN